MVYRFPIERPNQRALVAAAGVFSAMTALAVAVRLISRFNKNRGFDTSDYLMIASCLVALAYQGLSIATVLVGGMGFHVTEVVEMGGNEALIILLKLVLVIQIFWSLSLGLAKMSILAFYAKIFTIRRFIVAAQATAVFVALWAAVLFIGPFVICTPVAFNWDRSIPGGKCGDTVLMWTVTGVFNIITDLIVLLLPMPYLYNLQLPDNKKYGLMGVFSLGLGVCVISCVRLKEIVSINFLDFPDSAPIALLFSALEPCLLITTACAPFMVSIIRNRHNGSRPTIVTGPKSTARHPGGSGFDKLGDNTSSTDDLHAGAGNMEYNGTVSAGSRKQDDLEMWAITVKQEYRVEGQPTY